MVVPDKITYVESRFSIALDEIENDHIRPSLSDLSWRIFKANNTHTFDGLPLLQFDLKGLDILWLVVHDQHS